MAKDFNAYRNVTRLLDQGAWSAGARAFLQMRQRQLLNSTFFGGK